MHYSITMTFQRWITAACICCMFGVGTATAAPFDDGIVAYGKGDYAQAIRIFRPLAAQGDADAQFNLGRMYLNGKAVPKDDKEAVKWFRRAAVQGHVKAQYSLGWMYSRGEGIKPRMIRKP